MRARPLPNLCHEHIDVITSNLMQPEGVSGAKDLRKENYASVGHGVGETQDATAHDGVA